MSEQDAIQGVIYREAMIKQMNRKSAKKNLFITAPGGYGKTTAAAQWISFVRGTSTQLRLTNEDNDSSLFYTKVIHALLKLVKKEKEAADSAFMLDTFLEMLAKLPAKNTRCYLLIDDLHVIKNNDILNSLCLISRSVPPQPLLETDLFETMTKDDLLFSPEEVEWLGAEKNRKLTGWQIRDLLETTGGWAMYLSALLSGEQMYKTPQTLLEYLEARVWNLWDDETKKTLVQLAVPAEITPELCERLTGLADGQNTLERLVKKEGVFLSTAHGGGGAQSAYRFHDIFRDFLLERTTLEHSALLDVEEIRRLNNITAEWYYERGDYLTSGRYYLKNSDHEGIIRCLRAISSYHENLGGMSIEAITNFSIQYIKNMPPEFIAENLFLILRSCLADYENGDI